MGCCQLQLPARVPAWTVCWARRVSRDICNESHTDFRHTGLLFGDTTHAVVSCGARKYPGLASDTEPCVWNLEVAFELRMLCCKLNKAVEKSKTTLPSWSEGGVSEASLCTVKEGSQMQLAGGTNHMEPGVGHGEEEGHCSIWLSRAYDLVSFERLRLKIGLKLALFITASSGENNEERLPKRSLCGKSVLSYLN